MHRVYPGDGKILVSAGNEDPIRGNARSTEGKTWGSSAAIRIVPVSSTTNLSESLHTNVDEQTLGLITSRSRSRLPGKGESNIDRLLL